MIPAAPAPRIYVLDANAFVQAHRKFYALDLCPGYWSALEAHHVRGALGSIDRIRSELARNHDPLWTWVESQLPDPFFASTHDDDVIGQFGQAMTWVHAQPRFLSQAKAEAAGSADTWLCASAKARGHVVVTLETLDANVRRRVPLPNLCHALGVECITPFEMLRELRVQFHWPMRS